MKTVLTVVAIAILTAGFTGCEKKKSAADKVLECRTELRAIEKRLDAGDQNALKELTTWEAKCKKIVNRTHIKRGGLEPNPSNDKNF